jgi:hypothetical protein
VGEGFLGSEGGPTAKFWVAILRAGWAPLTGSAMLRAGRTAIMAARSVIFIFGDLGIA